MKYLACFFQIWVIIWEEISLAVEQVEEEEGIPFLQCLVILKDLEIKKTKDFKHFFSLENESPGLYL